MKRRPRLLWSLVEAVVIMTIRDAALALGLRMPSLWTYIIIVVVLGAIASALTAAPKETPA